MLELYNKFKNKCNCCIIPFVSITRYYNLQIEYSYLNIYKVYVKIQFLIHEMVHKLYNVYIIV